MSLPDFSLIQAREWHCGQMVRMLRHEHCEATVRVGMDAHRELRALFDQSSYRRAWLIDGRLAALGGVSDSLAAPYGFVWLCLTQEATKYPMAIVKEAKRQLDAIMRVKRELATTIIGGDAAALRLAVFLGFHVAHHGEGVPAETRYGRLRLRRYLEQDDELRIPAGTGYAILMGYHGEPA